MFNKVNNLCYDLQERRQFNGVSVERHFEVDERLVQQEGQVGQPGQRPERPPRQRRRHDAPAATRAGRGHPRQEEGPARFGEADKASD